MDKDTRKNLLHMLKLLLEQQRDVAESLGLVEIVQRLDGAIMRIPKE